VDREGLWSLLVTTDTAHPFLRHNASCLRVAGKFVEVSGDAGTLPYGMVQDVM
jgi:hypothetical protein